VPSGFYSTSTGINRSKIDTRKQKRKSESKRHTKLMFSALLLAL